MKEKRALFPLSTQLALLVKHVRHQPHSRSSLFYCFFFSFHLSLMRLQCKLKTKKKDLTTFSNHRNNERASKLSVQAVHLLLFGIMELRVLAVNNSFQTVSAQIVA